MYGRGEGRGCACLVYAQTLLDLVKDVYAAAIIAKGFCTLGLVLNPGICAEQLGLDAVLKPVEEHGWMSRG